MEYFQNRNLLTSSIDINTNSKSTRSNAFRRDEKRISVGGSTKRQKHLSLSLSVLETAFVEFSAWQKRQKETEREEKLVDLWIFSPPALPSFSRRHPVVVLLPSICGSIRPCKKRGWPVDKGILGWDEVSGRPQLSVMIASRGPF